VSDIAICYCILASAVLLFIWNRLPVEIVALGVALSLWATGVLTIEQSISGFGEPAVVFIASLFVVSEGLDSTGVTAWAGQQLIVHAGESRVRLMVFTMALVALLTALISVNGAVAALVPMVVVLAMRLGHSPSQLLIPVAFAAHAGSMLALTGTPVNIIVSEAADDAGFGTFGFFEFTLVGVPLVIGTMIIVVVLGPRLLPDRRAKAISPDLSALARTLTEQYALDDSVVRDGLVTRDFGVSELVVAPRSELIGEKVFPGMVSSSGDLVVLAVQRKGEPITSEAILVGGDILLVRGTWGALEQNLGDPDVLVVDAPGELRRQAVPLGPGARRALVILGAMVVLLATGLIPAVAAGLLAAMALVVTNVVPMQRAYRAISWTTVLLVAGMSPLSQAMQQTGAAAKLADGLVHLVGDAGPYALVAGLFVLTAALGQLISNMATALIVIPIAVSAAAEIDVSARPVLMAVNVAAAAAFLTPVATPANLMVMGPGGYQFGDYWKLGLCHLALFFTVATLLVPVIWSF
jgi:di/tricarboxylate transporter